MMTDLDEAIEGDKYHLNSIVKLLISTKTEFSLSQHLKLLSWDDWWLSALRVAYVRDYKHLDIQTINEVSLTWYKQLSFTDK